MISLCTPCKYVPSVFSEPQVRPEMEARPFPGTQAAHFLTPRHPFFSLLSWLRAGGGAAHLLLLQYSLLDCWQRELPSSWDQQPVCLKGSLLLLNAILTDESESIRAKNISGCRDFFQVAAWPIQRTFALVAKVVCPRLSSRTSKSTQEGPPSRNKRPSRLGA